MARASDGARRRLVATGLGRAGSIEPFDLELREGEVVGLAGLLGSGRTEIADLLFGIDKPDSGTLTVDGKPVDHFSPLRLDRPRRRALPRGPQGRGDRRRPDRAREHHPGGPGRPRLAALPQPCGASTRSPTSTSSLLKIATPDADQLVGNLSGGNQQKVILARWLATNPQVLILDEPTRGIDIGAKAEVQRLVLALAAEGRSCVFISSELEEVLRTSHRIVVLRDRAKVTEFAGEVDEQSIMQAMAGVGRDVA